MTDVLGIDLASKDWQSNGSVALGFGPSGWQTLACPAVRWPSVKLSARELAAAIDRYATAHGIAAVALDGPQGWRDPATPGGTRGVGRRCEYLCRTQGKTGTKGTSFPGTQLGWIRFCIEVFAELLALGHARLADGEVLGVLPPGQYWVGECFPTWTWREAGLKPLPGKNKKPAMGPYWEALRARWGLPGFPVAPGHDDLQGVVAALVAAGMVGGPVKCTRYGVASRVVGGDRLEGFIWSAVPLTGASAQVMEPVEPVAPVPGGDEETARVEGLVRLRVTQAVVDQIGRQGPTAAQIALKGLGVERLNGLLELEVGESTFRLVKGDTHAIWRSHQKTEETLDDFEVLFAALGDFPDEELAARVR